MRQKNHNIARSFLLLSVFFCALLVLALQQGEVDPADHLPEPRQHILADELPLSPSEACLRVLPLGRDFLGAIEPLPKSASSGVLGYEIRSQEQSAWGFSAVMKRKNRLLAVLSLADQVRGLGGRDARGKDAAGDVVEAGVAGGFTSFAVLLYLACLGDLGQRRFLLFDTWTGLPASGRGAGSFWRLWAEVCCLDEFLIF